MKIKLAKRLFYHFKMAHMDVQDSAIVQETNQVNIKILLEDLTFLASIPPGAKPCFNTKTVVYASSWSGALYRYWHSECRVDCLNKVNAILGDAGTFIESAEIVAELIELYSKLTASKSGLSNLCQTYQGIFTGSLDHVDILLGNANKRMYELLSAQFVVSEYNLEDPVEMEIEQIEQIENSTQMIREAIEFMDDAVEKIDTLIKHEINANSNNERIIPIESIVPANPIEPDLTLANELIKKPEPEIQAVSPQQQKQTAQKEIVDPHVKTYIELLKQKNQKNTLNGNGNTTLKKDEPKQYLVTALPYHNAKQYNHHPSAKQLRQIKKQPYPVEKVNPIFQPTRNHTKATRPKRGVITSPKCTAVFAK
jgi:hypothetical protein